MTILEKELANLIILNLLLIKIILQDIINKTFNMNVQDTLITTVMKIYQILDNKISTIIIENKLKSLFSIQYA
jgi:hypothetical protein